MKRIALLTSAVVAMTTASMAQTEVNLPFINGDYDLICPVGYSNPGLFSYGEPSENWIMTGISVYDANLSRVAQINANNNQIFPSLYVIDCSHKNFAPYDDTEFFITQHLFNSDDDFEYIVGDLSNNGRYLDKIYIKSTGSAKDIEINPGYAIEDYIYILALGDVNYLILSTAEDDSYLWYKVNGATNAVELIIAEKSNTLRAYPNPVKSGEPVRLQTNGSFTDCDIAVFSMRGSLVSTQSNNDAILDTNGIAPGIYTYKVASNGNQIGAGKLIVR